MSRITSARGRRPLVSEAPTTRGSGRQSWRFLLSRPCRKHGDPPSSRLPRLNASRRVNRHLVGTMVALGRIQERAATRLDGCPERVLVLVTWPQMLVGGGGIAFVIVGVTFGVVSFCHLKWDREPPLAVAYLAVSVAGLIASGACFIVAASLRSRLWELAGRSRLSRATPPGWCSLDCCGDGIPTKTRSVGRGVRWSWSCSSD